MPETETDDRETVTINDGMGAVVDMGAVEFVAPPAALELLQSNKAISYADLTKALAKPAEVVKAPAKLPTPVAISEDDKAALKKVEEVFGSVVPEEAREITPSETSALLEERSALKAVEKLISKRVDDITLTLLNHNDAAYERGFEDQSTKVLTGIDGEPLRNKDGHVIRAAKIYGDDPQIKTHFSLETREGSSNVDPKVLRAIGQDDAKDYFTHQDFLACTTPGRSFDENKAILLLKKKPHLLRAFVEASSTGLSQVSVNQR